MQKKLKYALLIIFLIVCVTKPYTIMTYEIICIRHMKLYDLMLMQIPME